MIRPDHIWFFFTVLLTLLLLVAVPHYARPHEAPSGWEYPKVCCAETHCHPVPCDELTEDANGNWQWGRFMFDKRVVAPSRDRACHVCTNNSMGLCAFIQQGA